MTGSMIPGPPDTRPRPRPTSPPPPKTADDLLFAAVDEILADLQSPARRDPSSSSAGEIATPDGPVQPRAGQPPLPGADFRLPRDIRCPS